MRTKTRALWWMITLIALLFALSACGNGGGGDDDDSEALQAGEVTVAALSGTYDLIDFTVTFPDGSTITPDDVTSFSGTMIIATDGNTRQTVTLDGITGVGEGTLTLIDDDTLRAVQTDPSCTFDIEFTFDGTTLTTFVSRAEALKCDGDDSSETEVWQKVSSQAPLARDEVLLRHDAADVEQGAIGGLVGAIEREE